MCNHFKISALRLVKIILPVIPPAQATAITLKKLYLTLVVGVGVNVFVGVGVNVVVGVGVIVGVTLGVGVHVGQGYKKLAF